MPNGFVRTEIVDLTVHELRAHHGFLRTDIGDAPGRTIAPEEIVSIKFTPFPGQGYSTQPLDFKVWGLYGKSEKWALMWSAPAGAPKRVTGCLTVEYKEWRTWNPVSEVEVAEMKESEPYICSIGLQKSMKFKLWPKS
jgi:hypothetical protein